MTSEPVRHEPGKSCPACRSTNLETWLSASQRLQGHCLDCDKRWTVGGRKSHRGGVKRNRHRSRLTTGQPPATVDESTPTPKEAP